jgi:hypothetical protein
MRPPVVMSTGVTGYESLGDQGGRDVLRDALGYKGVAEKRFGVVTTIILIVASVVQFFLSK